MRYLISLIAVAAVVACSDTPTDPTTTSTGGRLLPGFDVASGSTDSSATIVVASADSGTVGSPDSGTTSTDGTVTDPTPVTEEPVNALQPLYCPSSSEVRSARGVIGPEGGAFGYRGHELQLPPGAVSEPTLFEIVVPVSNYMAIEVHAVDRDAFVFAVPATITISFARCSSVPDSPLTAAYVSSSLTILQNMGGSVDRASKKVSFKTGHLSGFIVAY